MARKKKGFFEKVVVVPVKKFYRGVTGCTLVQVELR